MANTPKIDENLLASLSPQEREVALKALKEISQGKSDTLDKLKYLDYDEVPVDIETFLWDERYLGRGLIDPEGRRTVFPYWVETLKKIFPTNTTTKYNTLVLTGSIGIGKSFIAVLCMLYLLYRMLCLKDPYTYFGLQPIDKITFSLINVTIAAAEGVAWDKLQQLVQSSQWFMEHGEVSGKSNIVWKPNKRIELIVGSNNNAVIGRAVYCLDGDTIIKTSEGDKRLVDLVGEDIRVFSVNERGEEVLSAQCTVKPTIKTGEEYQIRLEDNTVIKCTSNHKFLLEDNTYKEASELSVDDKLFFTYHKQKNKIKEITRVILDELKQFYDVIEANPYHNFLIKTNYGYLASHNCNFTDEVNFAAMTTDVEKIKAKQKMLISQVDARMQSRFMKGTYLPTLNIIASSKSNDQSFLDSYINMKKKNESKTTLIIDEPQWVVRNDKDSPIKFWVAVGNKFLASEVLDRNASEEVVDSFRAKGYQMLRVPIGYYETFLDNVELALTDVAGISTTSALKYISGVRLNEIKTKSYQNPFTRDVIETGTNDTTTQYSQFFDLSRVPSSCRSKPLYIHLDMSIKGDKTGIGGVYIMSKSAGDDMGKSTKYRVAFSVSIKAPKGYEISFEKNRQFIKWLRSQGFNIKGISMDTFQSAQIKQQLAADGFDAKIISVDRLENIQDSKQKVCLPYAFFKSTMYEKRLELYDKCDLLTDEIVGLEKEPDGHIQHPEGGTQGCFTGDTKVSLVDGRELSFLELVDEYNRGKTNYVYSVNTQSHCIEAKPIMKAWLTNKNQPLLKVTLDNGEEIKCTYNHKFMLRNGEYIEAQELLPGDSLMPLYRKLSTKGLQGYRLLYDPFENAWHYEHRQFAEKIADEKCLVHHLDCNPRNNNPDNLLWCSKGYHQKIHAKLSTGSHSPEAAKKRSRSLSAHYEMCKNTPEFIERNHKISETLKNKDGVECRIARESKITSRRDRWLQSKYNAEKERQVRTERIRDIESTYKICWNDLTPAERDSYGGKYARLKNPNLVINTSKKISERHSEGRYENAHKSLQACNERKKELRALFPKVDPDLFLEIFNFPYDTLSSASEKGVWANRYREKLYELKNHKVVSIDFLDECQDVYDIEVKDNHNFALSAGIFVHNSKDQCDGVVGALFNASQNIEKFIYEFGETLEDLVDVSKPSSDAELKNQMNIDFEQALQELYTPASIKEAANREAQDSPYKDFGAGSSVPYVGPMFSDGMLIW